MVFQKTRCEGGKVCDGKPFINNGNNQIFEALRASLPSRKRESFFDPQNSVCIIPLFRNVSWESSLYPLSSTNYG